MIQEKFWSKDYICILLVSTFASFTNNVFQVIFPVYVLDLGGSNALTGMMMTGLTIAGIIIRIVMGPLIDGWGRKKMLVLGSSLYALNAWAYCFVTDFTGLFVLRIFHGVSQGIFFPVPPTIVADVTPKQRLVDAMGFFGVSSSIAFAVTPTIGFAIYEAFGARTLFFCAFLCAAISVLFAVLVKERYQKPVNPESQIDKPKKKVRLSAIIEFSILLPSMVSFFVYLGNSSVTNFLATCGIERGISQISLFFMLNNIVMIVMRLLTGRLTRWFDMHKIIMGGVAACFVGTLIIAFAQDIWWMLVASLLLGIGMTVVIQLLQVRVLSMVAENRRGVANSTFMLVGDVGNGLGATVWGGVSSYFGYLWTYLLSAAMVLIGGMTQILDDKKAKHKLTHS